METIPSGVTKRARVEKITLDEYRVLRKWMDDLLFYVLLNGISVISVRWVDDNGRLCAMEPCLHLRGFCLKRGSNSGSLGQ